MINEPYIKFVWWLKGFINAVEREKELCHEFKIIKTELEVLLNNHKEKL